LISSLKVDREGSLFTYHHLGNKPQLNLWYGNMALCLRCGIKHHTKRGIRCGMNQTHN